MFRKKSDKKRVLRKPMVPRPVRECAFCKNDLEMDYKNIELLSRYISSRGKILSRRLNGNCAKHQRKIAKEIKIARFLNLVPYVGRMFT